MSEVFKKRMDELKKSGKLTDFEYEQLVCLNKIETELISIDNNLQSISTGLANITITLTNKLK
jgi:negative regulator of sigma E activity